MSNLSEVQTLSPGVVTTAVRATKREFSSKQACELCMLMDGFAVTTTWIPLSLEVILLVNSGELPYPVTSKALVLSRSSLSLLSIP
jgi:hypothetical protein